MFIGALPFEKGSSAYPMVAFLNNFTSGSATGTIVLIVKHEHGCPLASAFGAFVGPFYGHGAVNALYDILIGLKFSLSAFGAAVATVFITLLKIFMAIAAAIGVVCGQARIGFLI